MIAATPPMGWNSWNTFYNEINEQLICETADALIQTGLREAGYQYIIVDDCWSEKERDQNGLLVPDRKKFPNGIRPVAEYVHNRGLKFGMYSCCGVRTCAGYPGSFEHEYADARQFASWGVDYLKYDHGYRPSTMATPLLYRKMAAALRSSGRDILLAACQWGTDQVYQWIRSSGAQTFRSTIDIRDNWESITAIALSQIEHQCYNGPDCFNDMDMLVVGMNGKGMNPETTSGIRVGCTEEEYRTHFALWAMMGSPLIIGCDIRSMDPGTKRILMDPDLIRINQDPECRPCYRLPVYAREQAFCLVKVLHQGEIAVGLFNFADKEETASVMLWDLGIPASEEIRVSVYDCYAKEHRTPVKEILETKVPAHGSRVFRLTVQHA